MWKTCLFRPIVKNFDSIRVFLMSCNYALQLFKNNDLFPCEHNVIACALFSYYNFQIGFVIIASQGNHGFSIFFLEKRAEFLREIW